MSSCKVGDRAGAIRSVNHMEVELLGYGVYDGKIMHPEYGFENPRITLDDGRQVWGTECWWGPEDKIKELIGTRTVINV